ncbi:hypothetical protein MTR67_023655 [Solanum verrucosum]|uniref:Uncharacterized protein n=1 Tax=Solanum verrucosum TaxID=315347 RepID=A0AAF0R070_SOLVR|nr:hypothetical protein MTR67_023655 [Solanum verrucosum]
MDKELQQIKSQQHDGKHAELSRSEDLKILELEGDVGKHRKTQTNNLLHAATVFIVFRKCAAKDHSAKLVGIADQLGDPPFGLVHRRLALDFSIIVFWIIVRHSTTSRNCSVICRLLLFTADLVRSFRAQHIGTKGEDKTFWRLAEWVRRFSDLQFFVLSAAFVPFLLSSVHAFPQTPNT